MLLRGASGPSGPDWTGGFGMRNTGGQHPPKIMLNHPVKHIETAIGSVCKLNVLFYLSGVLAVKLSIIAMDEGRSSSSSDLHVQDPFFRPNLTGRQI